MSVIRVLVIVFTMSVAALAFVTFLGCEGSASAEDRLAARLAEREARAEEREAERRAREEEHRRWREDFDRRMNGDDEEAASIEPVDIPDPPPKRRRQVRRFRWESPAETRGKLWNVPVEDSLEALVTALTRVCIAEADGQPQDCAGIWQVVKNNRRRSCDRGMIRRITECEEGGGETYLSAIRRHQRHVLGFIKARNKRAVWIGQLTPSCEMPEAFLPRQPEAQRLNIWDAQYAAKTCPQTVTDVRNLIAGKLPDRPGARVKWLKGRPMTWGGRCETGKAACDDRIACERVLARIPDTGTLNAFWCRIGSAGCRQDPEPICESLGYRYKQVEHRGRLVWKLDTGQPARSAEVQEEASPEDGSVASVNSDVVASGG